MPRMLLAAVVILGGHGLASAKDDPAVKQAAYQAALAATRSGPEPFDLTYLPRPLAEIQALTAIRPAALFAHPAFHGKIQSANDEFTELFKAVIGAESFGPGIENIESLLACGTVGTSLSPEKNAKRRYQLMVGGRGFVVRTTVPYDWAAAVHKWAPCEPASYRGRKYLTSPFASIPLFQMMIDKLPKKERPTDSDRVAFFTPDNRTLVLDNEPAIRRLIDRLATGKKQPLPPGWEKVSRGLVAMSIDNRKKEWSQFLFANTEQPSVGKTHPGRKLFMAADTLTFGIDVGPVTRFHLIAECPNRSAARLARVGSGPALAWFANPHPETRLAPEEEAMALLMKALLCDGTTKPTPLGFEYVGEVREDLLRWLAPFLDAGPPSS